MKNIFKIVLFISAIFAFNSCENDNENFDSYDGVAISFQQTSFNLSIPEENLTLEIPVTVSSLATTARSFDAVITSATPDTEGEYTIGSIVIPANEYEGLFTVDFEFDAIGGADGEVKELVISIVPPANTDSYNDVATISYFKEIVCNDLTIEIISDVWATETYWTLKQADGTVLVNRFFPYGGNSTSPQVYTLDFFLPDGDYILEIGDVFGDGMVGSGGGVTLVGSYSLTCSIITHASGGGELPGAVPDPFPGAPDAIVQVTAFTVNP